MSFGSALGYSAASSGLGTLFESANSVHQWEANNAGYMGFIDPLGTAFGSILNSSEKSKAQKQYKYEKKLMRMRYGYQKLAALQMPALIRQGYEDAGYNALLAFNGGNVASPVSAGGGDSYPHEGTKRGRGIDPLIEASLKQAEAQVEQTKAQTLKTKVSTYTDALGSALGLGGLLLAVKKLTGKAASASAFNAHGSPADKLVDFPLKSGNKGQMLGKLASALPLLGRLGLYGATAAGGVYGYTKLLDYAEREGNIKPISKDHPRYRHENGYWLRPKPSAPKRKHN